MGLSEVDNASVVRMRLLSSPTFQLLARGVPAPYFDSDGAWLHVHHDAVLGVAMVDDHAISGIRHNRVMECPVPIVAGFLTLGAG